MTTQNAPQTAEYTPRDTEAMIALNEAQRRKIQRLTLERNRALKRVDELEAARLDAIETIKFQSTKIQRLETKIKRLQETK